MIHWPDKVEHARNEGGVVMGGKGVVTFAEGSGVHKFVGVNSRNGAAGHVTHIVHACVSKATRPFNQILQYIYVYTITYAVRVHMDVNQSFGNKVLYCIVCLPCTTHCQGACKHC
jgi:hypothetical protein